MDIEYMSDTGSRHEWKCAHCDSDYVVTFHYMDESWSVQRLRKDGEREILDRTEAEDLLGEFPRDRALSLTQADTRQKRSKMPDRGGIDPDSTKTSLQEGEVGFGTTSRQEEASPSDPDASHPAA